MGADFYSASADRQPAGLPPFGAAPKLYDIVAEEEGTHRNV